jgi:zinc/manganese transport system substrate-binding protein
MTTRFTHADPRPTIARALGILLAGLLALVSVACSSSDDASVAEAASGAPGASRPTIVATTSILGDVVANVVGELATVQVLMPPGADPHDFEPSAQQAAELRTADLIVANGLLLEEGLLETIEAAETDGVPVIEIAPAVDPIAFAKDEEHSHDEGEEHSDEEGEEHSDEEGEEHSDGDDHEHGDEDPHVWQDPLRMAIAAELIADAVAQATGLDATTLTARADAYAAELEALDAELVAAYGAIPAECRKLVTDHDAFGYLAARYDFEIVGTIIPSGSELAEPSASELADLAATITSENVPAIFSESIFPTALAEALAREVGSDVALVTLYSDSLGDQGSGADTYVSLMRTNAERVTGALC